MSHGKTKTVKACEDLPGGYALRTYLKGGSSIILMYIETIICIINNLFYVYIRSVEVFHIQISFKVNDFPCHFSRYNVAGVRHS